jgi:flagellar hook-basal body protein
MVDDVITIYEQGDLVATDNNLDLAVDGDGYFTIVDPDGQEYFTRDGGFKLNFEGYLVNNNGLIVAGENGAINLQGEFINIEPDGSVYLDGEFVDTLKVVNIENPIKIWF